MMSPWLEIIDPLWRDFDRLKQEIERVYEFGSPVGNIRGVVKGAFPPVNVGETTDSVMVYFFVPGIEPSKIDLTLERNQLTIAGERDTLPDAGEGATPNGYYRRERFCGKFRRVISLPESVDPGKVEARYTNGILVLTIGKKEDEKSRKIEVSVS